MCFSDLSCANSQYKRKEESGGESGEREKKRRTWRKALKWRPWSSTAHWLTSHGVLSSAYLVRFPGPPARRHTASSGLPIPHQFATKEMPTGQSKRGNSQLRVCGTIKGSLVSGCARFKIPVTQQMVLDTRLLT